MAGFRQIAGSGYGSSYIDALIAGGAVWDMSTGPLTFAFGHQFNPDGWEANHGPPKVSEDGTPYLQRYWGNWLAYSWDAHQAQPVMNGLAEVARVANVNFNVTPAAYPQPNPNGSYSVSNANLVVFSALLPDSPSGSHTWASADAPQDVLNRGKSQSWLYLNTVTDGAWWVPHPGGMGFTMVLNMLGSALGLEQAYQAFPGVTSPYDPGPLGLNQAPFTVMTANWSNQGFGEPHGDWGSMKTFGAFDIAALQKIYGANTTTAQGNDVYELPAWNGYNGAWATGTATGWTCIWDTGGSDTISGQAARGAVKIDLRAATLADGDPNAGGFLSRQIDVAGGFTIAKGVVIENAIGGNGNDTLIGNSAANRLEGGAGDDTYYIDSANDVIVDTSGNDTVYATFNYSNAAIENVFVNGVKVVSGGVVTGTGATPVRGTAGNNTLVGKDTNDKLYGGLGNDTLTGKGGLDIFVFNTKLNKSTNKDKITDFSVRDDTIWLDNKIFKKLGSKGSESNPAAFKASFFKISDKAKDRDDYLIYNKKTGVLSYDADGSGKGQAIEFAVLKKNLALTYNDFAVI